MYINPVRVWEVLGDNVSHLFELRQSTRWGFILFWARLITLVSFEWGNHRVCSFRFLVPWKKYAHTDFQIHVDTHTHTHTYTHRHTHRQTPGTHAYMRSFMHAYVRCLWCYTRHQLAGFKYNVPSPLPRGEAQVGRGNGHYRLRN